VVQVYIWAILLPAALTSMIIMVLYNCLLSLLEDTYQILTFTFHRYILGKESFLASPRYEMASPLCMSCWHPDTKRARASGWPLKKKRLVQQNHPLQKEKLFGWGKQ